jgi:periplasmic divalent cation tolerance protein
VSHFSVYVTAPDRDGALAIARTLVNERLAACANIVGPITSVYRWEGKIEEASEVALIAKTTRRPTRYIDRAGEGDPPV